MVEYQLILKMLVILGVRGSGNIDVLLNNLISLLPDPKLALIHVPGRPLCHDLGLIDFLFINL
jgi:hypothetical protein